MPGLDTGSFHIRLVVCRSRITTGRAVVAASKIALKSTLRLVLNQPGRATRSAAGTSYDESQHTSLARARCARNHHGLPAVRRGWEHPVLARVGVSDDLFHIVSHHDARSDETRSRASSASYEGWPHGRKGTDAAHH